MKKFLIIITASVSLMSCTKNVSVTSESTNNNIFFQDVNIAVQDITAIKTGNNTVTVSFSTGFENNINRIELMSGATTTTFCFIQGVDVRGNSSMKKNYTINDPNATSSTMYYMLRFQNSSGNWTYSPYLTVQVN